MPSMVYPPPRPAWLPRRSNNKNTPHGANTGAWWADRATVARRGTLAAQRRTRRARAAHLNSGLTPRYPRLPCKPHCMNTRLGTVAARCTGNDMPLSTFLWILPLYFVYASTTFCYLYLFFWVLPDTSLLLPPPTLLTVSPSFSSMTDMVFSEHTWDRTGLRTLVAGCPCTPPPALHTFTGADRLCLLLPAILSHTPALTIATSPVTLCKPSTTCANNARGDGGAGRLRSGASKLRLPAFYTRTGGSEHAARTAHRAALLFSRWCFVFPQHSHSSITAAPALPATTIAAERTL